MLRQSKWAVTEQEKKKYVAALERELILLRGRLGISQAELAKAVSVSRQCYSAMENRERDMSWTTFLAFIAFFDNIAETRQMLRQSGAFPAEVFLRYNDGKDPDEGRSRSIAGVPVQITDKLDEQALHTLRTVLMLEYARCTRTPGETIVKRFDGVSLSVPKTE